MSRLNSFVFGPLVAGCLLFAGTGSVGLASETVQESEESVGALPSRLELEYEAYFSGLHVASARTVIQVSDAAYSVEGRVRARGLLDFFSDWRGFAKSEGIIDPITGVAPTGHRNEGYFRGDKRTIDLTFNADGTVDVVETDTEEEEDDPKTPVPEDSLPGSVDPFSAIMSLATLLNEGGLCEGSIPIYDGRRRYDLNLTQGETRAFEASRYSIFAGEATACMVQIERIGGFRLERSKYAETARNRSVWVAAPLPGLAPIPVRLDIETDYGNVLAHLTAARFGGEEIALTPGVDNLAD